MQCIFFQNKKLVCLYLFFIFGSQAKAASPSNIHIENIQNWYVDLLAQTNHVRQLNTPERTRSKINKFGDALGLAQHALRKSDFENALKILSRLSLPPDAPTNLNSLYTILLAQAWEGVGQPASAVLALKPSINKLSSIKEFKKQIVSLYYRNLINARLINEAEDFYESQIAIFSREFSELELNPEKLELARAALDFSQKDEAQKILYELAALYPISYESREAVNLLNKNFCPQFDFDSLWTNSEVRQEHAKNILYSLGPIADIRQFVFALVDIDEKTKASKKSLINSNPNDRQQALDKLEFLLSVREYEVAEQTLENLKNFFLPKSTHTQEQQYDRFLFLQARTLNANNNPSKAALAYRNLYLQFPKSKYFEQARVRYSYSLHFNQDYKKAARSFLAMPTKGRRRTINLWNAFWDHYLAKDFRAANQNLKGFLSQKRLDSDAMASAQYWQMRILMNQNKDFLKLRDQLSAKQSSFYHLLARELSARSDKTDIKTQENFDFLGLLPQTPNLPEKYRIAQQLLDFGLSEYAQELIEDAASFVKDESEAKIAGALGAKSLNFKIASLVPRRNIWSLRALPETQEELSNQIKENKDIWMLSYPLAYGNYLKRVADTMGVSPYLILAIMRAESNYDANAESPVGALGLLQIMPKSGVKIANALGIPNFDPRQLLMPNYNIYFSAWYLSRLVKHYRGNVALAIAAYNAGPEAVDRWIRQTPKLSLDEFLENIPFRETKTYVAKVLPYLDMYHKLYLGSGNQSQLLTNFSLPQPLNEPDLF